MNPVISVRNGIKLTLLFSVLLFIVFLLPGEAFAKGSEKIVRVGWFDSPFNIMDDFGRRSGYSYDYQQKLAAYTGWTYEYVEGSWPDLLQMLEDGRIDLLSDVSYTEERAEHILYSSLPMGAEKYYLYVDADNQDISVEDYASFRDKKVGVNKGSIQEELFREWSGANGLKAELVELTGSENQNVTELFEGNIDMYLSVGGFHDESHAVPVCKIGSSDFFFAVSKARPELLVELNNALNRVQDAIPFYDEHLYAKYLQNNGTSLYLSAEEKEWAASHGRIRLGYQDNCLAFCAKDPETGELTGALKDYLSAAEDSFENAHLDFEPICYPSSAEAMEAMKNGEVDCVFPANLTDYDGENNGVYITSALIHSNMAAVIREENQQKFLKQERVTVAVNADDPNYDMFLKDHFPDWRPIYYPNMTECLKAIARGEADCLLISIFRYNSIANLCGKYRLTTLSSGIEMDYCFAVNRNDTILYSILTKTTGIVPTATMNSALAYYSAKDAKDGFFDSLRQNMWFVSAAFAGMTIAFLILLVRFIRLKKEIKRHERKIPAAEDFYLFNDIPVSYSVYHVTHMEHSETYDAKIIYVNHRYEEVVGVPAQNVLGRSVRELYPYLGDKWFRQVKLAALDGETVEGDHFDELSGTHYHFVARQVSCPGYCSITYQEVAV